MNAAVLTARARMTQNSVIVQDGMNFKGRAGKPYPGTFTRGSKAWLGGVEYAAHTPRTVDYAGGKLVLLEGLRTNILANSLLAGGSSPSTPPSHNWTTILGSGYTANQTYSAFRAGQAWRLTLTTAGSQYSTAMVQNTKFPVTQGVAYTVSAKVAGNTNKSAFMIRYYGADGSQLIGADLFGPGLPAASTPTLRSFTFTPPANAATFQVMLRGIDALNDWMEIAEPQVESGPFASSYIPTTGAAVSRQADTWDVPLPKYSSGTIAVAFQPTTFIDSGPASAPTSGVVAYNQRLIRLLDPGNPAQTLNVRTSQHGGAAAGASVLMGNIDAAPYPLVQTVKQTTPGWRRIYAVFNFPARTLEVYTNGTLSGRNTAMLSAFFSAFNSSPGSHDGGFLAPGAPALAIPFIRPWALSAAEIATEDTRWQAALDAVTLPPL